MSRITHMGFTYNMGLLESLARSTSRATHTQTNGVHINNVELPPSQTVFLEGEQVDKIVEGMNAVVKSLTNSIEFEIDKQANIIKINIVDKETGEVIRTIPPEELINTSVKIQEFARSMGFLVDELI